MERHQSNLLFVQRTIAVELEGDQEPGECSFAIVKSYLKAIGKKHGLLLNFVKPILEVKGVLCQRVGIFPGFLAS